MIQPVVYAVLGLGKRRARAIAAEVERILEAVPEGALLVVDDTAVAVALGADGLSVHTTDEGVGPGTLAGIVAPVSRVSSAAERWLELLIPGGVLFAIASRPPAELASQLLCAGFSQIESIPAGRVRLLCGVARFL